MELSRAKFHCMLSTLFANLLENNDHSRVTEMRCKLKQCLKICHVYFMSIFGKNVLLESLSCDTHKSKKFLYK